MKDVALTPDPVLGHRQEDIFKVDDQDHLMVEGEGLDQDIDQGLQVLTTRIPQLFEHQQDLDRNQAVIVMNTLQS